MFGSFSSPETAVVVIYPSNPSGASRLICSPTQFLANDAAARQQTARSSPGLLARFYKLSMLTVTDPKHTIRSNVLRLRGENELSTAGPHSYP